jgi:hypothetical protein
VTLMGAWPGWAATLASTVPIPRPQLTVRKASVAVGSDARRDLERLRIVAPRRKKGRAL